jgi:hypothetical protein
MNEMRSRQFGPRAEVSPVVGEKQPRGANADSGLRSIRVPRAETRTNDERDGDRHRLPQEAVILIHDGVDRSAELINLSNGGAMVSVPGFEPMLWERVDLLLGEEGRAECVVRWIKNARIGLEFAHETHLDCSVAERDAVLAAVLERSFPGISSQLIAEPAEQEAPVAPAQPAPEHRRSEARHPLIWSGVIHYDHQSTPVRLRNISATGAMIECGTALPVGAEPLLDLGESGTLFATVCWQCGDQAGLRFHERFELTSLARSKPQVAPVVRVEPRRDNARSVEGQCA